MKSKIKFWLSISLVVAVVLCALGISVIPGLTAFALKFAFWGIVFMTVLPLVLAIVLILLGFLVLPRLGQILNFQKRFVQKRSLGAYWDAVWISFLVGIVYAALWLLVLVIPSPTATLLGYSQIALNVKFVVTFVILILASIVSFEALIEWQ